jgi:hypothetical protein
MGTFRLVRAAVALLLWPPIISACGAFRSDPRRSGHTMPASVAMEIVRSEIDSLRPRVPTAYDLIRRLRPAMLNSRDPRASSMQTAGGSTETSRVSVYVDGLYVGGLEVLSTIPARSVTSIRRISSATASADFGSGLSGGAIVVTTDVPTPRARF